MNIDDKKSTNLSNKYTKDMHKMEREIKKIDFSYLEIDKLNVEVENQSLTLQLKYLKGE